MAFAEHLLQFTDSHTHIHTKIHFVFIHAQSMPTLGLGSLDLPYIHAEAVVCFSGVLRGQVLVDEAP